MKKGQTMVSVLIGVIGLTTGGVASFFGAQIATQNNIHKNSERIIAIENSIPIKLENIEKEVKEVKESIQKIEQTLILKAK